MRSSHGQTHASFPLNAWVFSVILLLHLHISNKSFIHSSLTSPLFLVFALFFTASNLEIMFFNFVCILIEPITKRLAVFHILITSLTVSSFKSLKYGHFFKNFGSVLE